MKIEYTNTMEDKDMMDLRNKSNLQKNDVQ